MDTLISNVTIVTMNERMQVLFGSHLGIENGKICYMDSIPPKEQPKTIIDGTGMVVMPGLINCHTHLATTVLRGYLDDLSNQDALNDAAKVIAGSTPAKATHTRTNLNKFLMFIKLNC